ncbi:type 2 isopentenyl-diphosphate Delta-isomerase [Paenibacillus sp. An7]|uniref:type 2 isopentenyl-diphosphate Delta-isomerase n=1 Tax=Paenibacillus sp. An7 TaxID=2689577 RepID=UPI001356BE99|nr:type 2 isopentenyl-diphosphate Delta-isomerase [Paenibacillus sp. An7]
MREVGRDNQLHKDQDFQGVGEHLLPEVPTGERKIEHVRLCLNEDVNAQGITAGFESYRFRHAALPELDFADVQLNTMFLGQELRTPFLISSMTGGSGATGKINERLAAVAEARGWAFGVGSVRAAVEKEELAASFSMRKFAPTIPIIANLGAVQLNYGFGKEACQRAVDIAGASMLVLHLNGLQEIFQPEGNTNFSGLLKKIEKLCGELSVPVGVKEVGWGIDGETAARLYDAGVSFVDVAGAGGTSWVQVEKFRNEDMMKKAAAEAFVDWGISTAECINEVRQMNPGKAVIGSGGLTSGVDAAKAIALGADLVGFGRSLLGAAVESEEALHQRLHQVEFELRTAMFGVGAPRPTDLQGTKRLIRTIK